MKDDVLITVAPSAARRMIGLGTLLLLGAMLVYLGLTLPVEIGGKLLLVLFGAAALYSGERLRRATASCIELREDGIYDADGTLIASIDSITRIERGMLAFKPSNGFVLRVENSMGRAWRPGLWWRIGKNIGVGGVTSAAQTKAMSEIIAMKVHKPNEM